MLSLQRTLLSPHRPIVLLHVFLQVNCHHKLEKLSIKITLPQFENFVNSFLPLWNIQSKFMSWSLWYSLGYNQAKLSKKEKAKSCSEKLAEALQDQLSSHGVSWTEVLKNDVPQCWQRHGDLVLIGEDCFALPAWKKLGESMKFSFSTKHMQAAS